MAAKTQALKVTLAGWHQLRSCFKTASAPKALDTRLQGMLPFVLPADGRGALQPYCSYLVEIINNKCPPSVKVNHQPEQEPARCVNSSLPLSYVLDSQINLF